MKSASEAICLEEIPDEISFSLAISNCPCQCRGCHSQYLWEDIGRDAFEVLNEYLKKNSDLITCVLFLGGDDDKQKDDLINCLKYIRLNYPKLKTALYSGFNQVSKDIIDLLDYVKIGPYIKERGGLNNPDTNQRLYKIEDGYLNNITSAFWKKPYS